MGKWPDCHQRSVNWLVRKRFAIAIRNVVREELCPPATDQKETGKDINKTKKAMSPKPKIGSPRKWKAKSVKIQEDIGNQ